MGASQLLPLAHLLAHLLVHHLVLVPIHLLSHLRAPLFWFKPWKWASNNGRRRFHQWGARLPLTGFPQNRSWAAVGNHALEFVMHRDRHLGRMAGWGVGGSCLIAYRVGGDLSQRTPPPNRYPPPHPPAAQRLCIPSAFHPSVPPPTSTHLNDFNQYWGA